MSDTLLSRRAALAGTAASVLRFRLARAQATPIRIGFLTSISGNLATEAQDQVRAAQVAITEFNQRDGLNGRTAELLVRDDRQDPAEATQRCIELIEKDRVDFVAGGISAEVQLAIDAVAKQRRVLFVALGPSDAINDARESSRFTFHQALTPYMLAGAVARHAFPKFGNRVAFLAADDAYGAEAVRGFLAVGKKLGIEIVADLRHPRGIAGYSEFLPYLQSLKPDVLCLCNFGRDQQLSVQQAAESGLKHTTQLIVPLLLSSAREAGGMQAFAGVIGGAGYYWKLEDTVPSARIFNDRFRAMHDGRLPTELGALGYAGTTPVLAAMRAAKSTESDRVADALAALKYDLYKGSEYYRGCDHQAVQSVLILQSKEKLGPDPADVFDISDIESADDVRMRSCSELGHG